MSKQLALAQAALKNPPSGGEKGGGGPASSVGREGAVAIAAALDAVVQSVVYHGLTCGWGRSGTASTAKAASAESSGGIRSLAAYATAVSELHPKTEEAAKRVVLAAAPDAETLRALERVWDGVLCEGHQVLNPEVGHGSGSGSGSGWGLSSVAEAVRSAGRDPNPLLAVLRAQWREGARLMEGSRGAWAACRSSLRPPQVRRADGGVTGGLGGLSLLFTAATGEGEAILSS